ncbi:transcription elongation factor GreA [Fodinicola feengrottensis]|uniref:Transcription elongation factor GreA n=1 Tax=Fodinicola feengrottensis TaxID=435914 RepID=A0ABN2J9G6_9ACTN
MAREVLTPGSATATDGNVGDSSYPPIEELAVSTTDPKAHATWLTQEAFDRLKAELDGLIANRTAVAAEINERREEGDLKENGGYHAAREEQGKQEGRIRELNELLRTAEVHRAPDKVDKVELGVVVSIHFDGDKDDTETFLLGSREIAKTTTLTVYSPESALGSAITGHRTGDTVKYTTPTGAEIKVTIDKIAPFTG